MKAKKPSKAVTLAEGRAERLSSISPTLDLGNGLTPEAFAKAIAGARALVEAYNGAIACADALRGDIRKQDVALAALSGRMLAAEGVAYGKDSPEYQKAGGVRASERKRPARRPRKTA